MASLYETEKLLPKGFRAYEARQIEEMRDDLASVEARLGRVVPSLHGLAPVAIALREIQETARAAKDYQTADAIRAQVEKIESSLDYATPNWRDRFEK